jgi:hypothetical protein
MTVDKIMNGRLRLNVPIYCAEVFLVGTKPVTLLIHLMDKDLSEFFITLTLMVHFTRAATSMLDI